MNIDAPIPAMAPPIPQVAPAASAQAVIAPTPTDRWSALKQIGWWKPIDSIVIFLMLAAIVTGIFTTVFGRMTFNVAVIGLLGMLIVLAAWGVALIYRCMDFVVQLRAAVEMLPYDSARIALGYMQGGQAPKR